MSRYAYVNGRYLPFRDAKVHVEDRGYQFADAVYEVCEVRAGRLIDERRHLDRLERSLDAIRIRLPMSRAAATGIAVVSMLDNRWGRVDIKSVGLLPNALARQAAIDQGAREAWFIDEGGIVTEGASANAWIVTVEGKLVTRRADHAILSGITRSVVFEAVKAQSLTIEERPFALQEAYTAREAFITSATQNVMPVVRIDGHAIGDGKPGPVAAALRREFHRFAKAG